MTSAARFMLEQPACCRRYLLRSGSTSFTCPLTVVRGCAKIFVSPCPRGFYSPGETKIVSDLSIAYVVQHSCRIVAQNLDIKRTWSWPRLIKEAIFPDSYMFLISYTKRFRIRFPLHNCKSENTHSYTKFLLLTKSKSPSMRSTSSPGLFL